MKDKVYVNIKGLQMAADAELPYYDNEDESPIEIINVGTYSIVNGREYIKYDEVFEGEREKCTNLIKISENSVEITKKGTVVAHISFIPGQKTMTYYETPYGNIYMGIFSRSVDIEREQDKIRISIDYSLEINYEQVSDCKVFIEVASKGKFAL